jgi:hypothetical protein
MIGMIIMLIAIIVIGIFALIVSYKDEHPKKA